MAPLPSLHLQMLGDRCWVWGLSDIKNVLCCGVVVGIPRALAVGVVTLALEVSVSGKYSAAGKAGLGHIRKKDRILPHDTGDFCWVTTGGGTHQSTRHLYLFTKCWVTCHVG